MVEAIFPPLPLNKFNREFTRRCVDVIVDMARTCGFDPTGFRLGPHYQHWEYGAAVAGDPMKYVKWRFNAFYAHHQNQAFDTTFAPYKAGLENPGILLGGKFYSWLRVLRNSDPCRWSVFLTSVLSFKKGCPRPGYDRLRKAEEDTFVKLTTAPPASTLRPIQALNVDWSSESPPKMLERSMVTFESMSEQIRRTVTEVFEGSEYTWYDRIEPFLPSTNANYVWSRKQGGAVGQLYNCIQHDLDPDFRHLSSEDPLVYVDTTGTRRLPMYVYDDSLLRKRFRDLYQVITRKALVSRKAIPVALAEALKTRVITKGPPYLQTFLKPLQRKMWKVLKDHPTFVLTGTPITEKIVHSAIGANLGKDQSFLSVDYSDATNEIYSWCSEVCLMAVSASLDLLPDEIEAFQAALTGHELELTHEPPRDSTGAAQECHLGSSKGTFNLGECTHTAPQRRGQLMGSIVSFPILCLVNAAICRWALELSTGRRMRLTDCPLLINGDDAVMRMNSLGRTAWERIASFCGLNPSPGKVYFSDTFLNMNSTTFYYHREGYYGFRGDRGGNRICCYERAEDVNMGLLYGFVRSSAQTNSDEGSLVGARCRELVERSPGWMAEYLIGRYIHLHRKSLPDGIPWFIPEQFGGIGLPAVGRFQPRDLDLRLARKIWSGYTLPSLPPMGSWQLWRNAERRFPKDRFKVMPSHEFFPDPKLPDRVISRKHLLGLVVIEQLFHSKAPLTETRDPKGIANYHNRLAKVWRTALTDQCPLPEPFNLSRLPPSFSVDDVPLFFSRGVLSAQTQRALYD